MGLCHSDNRIAPLSDRQLDDMHKTIDDLKAKLYSHEKLKQDLEQEKQKSSLAFSMPSYCIKDPKMDPATYDFLKNSWDDVIQGTSDVFKTAKQKTPSLTAVVFFHDNFYDILFDLNPAVKAMFVRGIKSQGAVLANILTTIIASAKADPVKFELLLKHLAVRHNQMGIQPAQYAVIGYVLLVSLRRCLGNLFNSQVEWAWLVTFSIMMKYMMPVVIKGTVDFDETNSCPDYNTVIRSTLLKANEDKKNEKDKDEKDKDEKDTKEGKEAKEKHVRKNSMNDMRVERTNTPTGQSRVVGRQSNSGEKNEKGDKENDPAFHNIIEEGKSK